MSIVWLEDLEGQPAPLPPAPTLVLLHFAIPYRRAGHVVIRGGDRRGRAWRLLQAVRRAGGAVQIARVWSCASVAEREETLRKVTGAGSRGRYCPVCRAGAAGAAVGKGAEA